MSIGPAAQPSEGWLSFAECIAFIRERGQGEMDGACDTVADALERHFSAQPSITNPKENSNSLVVAQPSAVTQTLVQQLIDRDVKGREKYGKTLDRDDLSRNDWLQHLIEELLDAAGYAEAAKRNRAQPSNQLCPNCEEYTLKITNSGLSPTELQNELGAAFETMKHAIEHMDTEHLDAARSALTWSLDRADKLGIGKQPSNALSGKVTDAMVEHVGKGLYIYWGDVNAKCRETYSAKVRKVLETMPAALEAMKP